MNHTQKCFFNEKSQRRKCGDEGACLIPCLRSRSIQSSRVLATRTFAIISLISSVHPFQGTAALYGALCLLRSELAVRILKSLPLEVRGIPSWKLLLLITVALHGQDLI